MYLLKFLVLFYSIMGWLMLMCCFVIRIDVLVSVFNKGYS